MKRFALLLCLAASSLCAEPFECAKLSKASGTVIRSKTSIQTGLKSRVELTFPDGKVIRLGSNVSFECIPGYLEVVLDSGTMLQSTPKGARKGVIRAGAVIVSGTDFQLSNVEGQNKVIGLNEKTSVALAANSKAQVKLRPGEMVVVPPGATKMPKSQAINLQTLTSSSTLMQMGPVPAQTAIDSNAARQQPKASFKIGALSPDGSDPMIGLAASAMQTQLIIAQETAAQQQQLATQLAAQQAAQTVAAQQQIANARQFAAQQQTQQAAAQQLAAEQAAAAQAAAVEQAAARQLAAQQARLAQQQGNNGVRGNQGNQGQGNMGQGNNGNSGNNGNNGNNGNPNPPGQNK